MNQTIGIFGGSFNPVHRAHLTMARRVIERLNIARLMLLPSNIPPHKSAGDLAPTEHRLAMCRLAVEGVEHLEVSDLELRRQGPSYTIDTLRELHREYPHDDLVMVIGADMLRIFHKWVDFEQIHGLVRLVTFPRPGVEIGDLPELRRALGDAAVERILGDVLQVEPMDISSTDIRRRVGRGEPIDHLVPQAVAEYIDRHGLYR